MAQTANPITTYRLTDCARMEMARRQISGAEVARVLAAPEQTELVREGCAVYQSRIPLGDSSKIYVLRVFVDIDREPPEVVTVYRSSKLQKYWRTDS
jgi:hypothetical protein